MLIDYIDFVVEDSNELVQHGFIGPRSEERSNNILLSFSDDKNGFLIWRVVTGLLIEFSLHLSFDFHCNASACMGAIEVSYLWHESEAH